jgi:hypothetical protein
MHQEVAAFGGADQATAKEMPGCPHEEGVDYPEGEACPDCPFWAGRSRPIGA